MFMFSISSWARKFYYFQLWDPKMNLLKVQTLISSVMCPVQPFLYKKILPIRKQLRVYIVWCAFLLKYRKIVYFGDWLQSVVLANDGHNCRVLGFATPYRRFERFRTWVMANFVHVLRSPWVNFWPSRDLWNVTRAPMSEPQTKATMAACYACNAVKQPPERRNKLKGSISKV